ncbi:MAG: 16S rRNA (cytosine(1402)-N(4))-methyltransferase RsmH [Eubacteriales bacterium]|nr:16S rRNA (cytosine(1402)-N(4))-methyltransferase RsmH [Eubacteriales bacterium]
MSKFEHRTVLLEETIAAIRPAAGKLYLDCTLGGGGHSLGILTAVDGNCVVIGIDKDETALEAASERIKDQGYAESFKPVKASFSEAKQVLQRLNIEKVDGVIADLGFSSPQIDRAERGFSYLHDGPLDMRMDLSQSLDCRALIAEASAAELQRIFSRYGEERYAKGIARAIVKARETEPIERTAQLAEIIANAVPAKVRREKHPARKCFQALRIAVNGELDALEALLESIPEILNPDSRVAIISFHSLEDRLVKEAMRDWTNPCKCPKQLPCNCGLKPLGKAEKAIRAGEAELSANPRARSATLRVFNYLPQAD